VPGRCLAPAARSGSKPDEEFTAMPFRLGATIALTLAAGLGAVLSASMGGDSVSAVATNLVSNGTFESRTAGWKLCGGASLSDTKRSGKAAAAHGRFAIRLGNPTRGKCPSSGGFLDTDVYQAVSQQIDIPGNAPALTLSFWYYVEGDRNGSIDVGLARGFNDGYSSDTSVFFTVSHYENPGWQEFRQVLQPDELRKLKGRKVFVQFRFVFPLTVREKQTFRIDDVQVAPAVIKTPVKRKVPAALKGDGARPIVFVRAEPIGQGLFGDYLYWMDTDGTKAARLYEGLAGGVYDPEWSPNGDVIAVVDNTIANGVPTSAVTLVEPATGETATLERLPDGNEDFTQVHDGVSWSPNGRSLAASVFAYDPGGQSGLARIEVLTVATGKSVDVLDYATNPSWGRKNRLIFEAYDLLGDDRGWGTWDALMTSNRPKATQVIPGNLFEADADPTWAPDGQHFVTVRSTSGRRYEGGTYYYQDALMLFDRKDPGDGRMLLLADFGSIRDPAFSPDGEYLLYTIQTKRGSNIWWLEVASGATGPLTTNNRSSDPHWRAG
jgi:hypothetical protein